MDLTFHNLQTRAQEIAERYLHDDIVYQVIDLFHLNVYTVFIIFLTSLISYKVGKKLGEKALTFITDLRKKYENIETKKKAIEKRILFYKKLEKWISRTTYVFYLLLLCYFGFIGYKNKFEYMLVLHTLWQREVSIIVLGFGVIIFILYLTRSYFSRKRELKHKNLLSMNKNVEEIGEALLNNLGDELVSIIKIKLKGHIPKSLIKDTAVQTVSLLSHDELQNGNFGMTQVRHEVEKEPMISKAEALNICLKQQLVHEKNLNILKMDLERHKKLVKNLKSFVWCEYCSKLGTPLEPKSEEISDPIKLEKKEDDGSIKDEDGSNEVKDLDLSRSISKTHCTENCMRRYFERGLEMSQEFEQKGEEIKNYLSNEAKENS